MYKILFSKLKKYNIYKILFIILILIIIFILLKKQYVIERFDTSKIDKLNSEIKKLDYIKNELNSAIETIKDYNSSYREFILKYDVNDVNDPNDPANSAKYKKFKEESPFSRIVKASGDNAAIKTSLEKYSVLNQDPVTQIYEPTPNYDYKPIWNDINSIFNKSKKFIIHILKALTYITKYYTFPVSTFNINNTIFTDIKKYNFNDDISFPIAVPPPDDDGGKFLDYVKKLINYMKTNYYSSIPDLSTDTGSILQNIYKSFVILIYNKSLTVQSDPVTSLTFNRSEYETDDYKFTLFAQQKHIKATTDTKIKSFNNSDNRNAYERFKNLIVDLEDYFKELIPFKKKLEETTEASPALEININKLKNTIDNEYITVKNKLAEEKGVIKDAEENYQKNTYYLKVYDDKYYKIDISDNILGPQTTADAAKTAADDAVAKADGAVAKADAAVATADKAVATADAAKTVADAAKTAADAAKTVADGTVAEADAAVATADADVATADAAVAGADVATAVAKADAAKTAADAAVDKADAAKTAADAAKTAVDDADDADAAVDTADAAVDTADAAVAGADAAKAEADAAKATADATKAKADAEDTGIPGKLTEADEIYENNKNKIKFSINEKNELEINLIKPVIYNNEISKTNSIPGGTNSVGSFTVSFYDSKISDHPIMIDIEKDTNDYSTVKDYLIHFYLDKNINDIFDGNVRNIIYKLNEIITENEYNELKKQSKLKTTLGDDVEDLKEYNDLKNQYNNIMNNKEKRIKEHEEAQLYKRGQTILNKKISFNKKWIRTIKDITIGVHIFLYLVILVLVVYKLQ